MQESINERSNSLDAINPRPIFFLALKYDKELIELAENVLKDNQLKEAKWLLERALSCFPGSTAAYKILGNVCEKLGELTQGEKALRSAAAIDPLDITIIESLARIFIAQKKFDDVFKLIPTGIKLEPHNHKLRHALAKALIETNQIEEGFKLISLMLQDFPNDPEIIQLMLRLAEIVYALGANDFHNETIMHLMNEYPTHGVIAAKFINFLAKKGGLELAFKTFEQISPSVHDQVPIVREMADIVAKAGQTKAAAALLESLIKTNPNPEARKHLVSLLPPKSSSPNAEKTAVFIEPNPRARSMKIAKALRSSGWTVILLHQNDLYFDPSAYFDETLKYGNPEHALYLASKFHPKVCHVFSGNADEISMLFVKEKPSKVVFDPYDTVEGMIKQFYSYNVGQMQRFCIENADGVCCRDLRVQHLKKVVGYKLPKSIYFSDYIDELRGPSAPISSDSNQEIHVVNCGNFPTNKDTHEMDSDMLRMGRAFAKDRVHLHIYPTHTSLNAGNFDHIFADYIAYSRETPYFKIHRSVPMDQLATELRQYHFGLNGLWLQVLGQANPYYAADYHRLCLSARNIDCLEAGLPLIVPKLMNAQFWSFNRFGIAIDATPKFFENPRAVLTELFSKKDLKERITRAQQQNSISWHIHRLIEFYESL